MRKKFGSDVIDKAAKLFLKDALKNGQTFIVDHATGTQFLTAKNNPLTIPANGAMMEILNHCTKQGWIESEGNNSYVITHAGIVVVEKKA